MNVLAAWSELESDITELFVGLLGASPIQSAAIFSTIRSQQGQRDAMSAVATTALPIPEERDIIFAVLAVYENSSKLRNRIAHWTWGYVDELPDAVLLADPASIAEYQARSAEKRKQFYEGALPNGFMIFTDPSRIWAYKKRDFQDGQTRIERATELTRAARKCLQQREPGGAPQLLQLSSEPEIHAELERLNKRRKIDP